MENYKIMKMASLHIITGSFIAKKERVPADTLSFFAHFFFIIRTKTASKTGIRSNENVADGA
ncbi:hypothetical protein ABD75_02420 [Bacillus vallismortis]|nr:hypothetical protein [Bacillus vallismortis]QAV08434.1 hypothetical protein BV11031_07340 [Bacillus vallismortis]